MFYATKQKSKCIFSLVINGILLCVQLVRARTELLTVVDVTMSSVSRKAAPPLVPRVLNTDLLLANVVELVLKSGVKSRKSIIRHRSAKQ